MAAVRYLISGRSSFLLQLLNIKHCHGRNCVNEMIRAKSKPNECLEAGSRERFICKKCGVVQEIDPTANYFKIFDIEEKFNIDIPSLTTAFRSLQAQFHPDKFSLKSEKEQQLSSDCSTFLNTAYQTLIRPLDRGQYLLALRNQSIENGSTLDKEFLMEIMEINELLVGEITMQTLNDIKKENNKTILALIDALVTAFKNKELSEAKMLLSKLKYYTNIEDKIKCLEVKRGIVK